MSVSIRREDFSAFFQAPRAAYGLESPFVSIFDADLRAALDRTKNPFLRRNPLTYFTAHRNGESIGRITVQVHEESNRRFGWNRASFGYFDCANDGEAAGALLGAAESWARERGYEEIWGNFNLTAVQQMGVVVDGFDSPPYSDQIWNGPHIAPLLESAGYTAEFPVTSFEVDVRSAAAAAAASVPAHAPELAGVRLASMGRLSVKDLLPGLRNVLNDGFEDNSLFVPVAEDELAFQARDLSWVIDPRITWLAWEGSELIGALIVIPDLNPLLRKCGSRMSITALLRLVAHRRRPRRAVVIFQSVVRRWQRHGVGAALALRCLSALDRAGFETLGVTWVADGNSAALASVRRVGARPMHRIRLFRKSLS